MATSHGHHDPVPTGPHGEEVAGSYVPSGPTHEFGYEPDKVGLKTILAVPAAVIVTGAICFLITTLLFSNVFAPGASEVPATFPGAAAQNAAPLDERLGRISSDDPTAPVNQPRLEGLQKREVHYKDGNPANQARSNLITPEMITTKPTDTGNPPMYHAEDLRPANVPAVSTAAVDPQTGAVARIPVGQAIKLVTDPANKQWAGVLPVTAGALSLDDYVSVPKESNGGNPRWPFPVAGAKPAQKKDAGPKKEAEPKKDAEPKEPAQKDAGKE